MADRGTRRALTVCAALILALGCGVLAGIGLLQLVAGVLAGTH